ncbi:TOM1-like protein 2 isoform X2 [Parasteatoda tepidariorum]|nr:TOM1-like protein 2 isoform X2 [Parasteatoda tepidariorum]
MAGLLATLGGNPLNTPVGQKIEQATDAALPSENWALNMEICDLINDTDEGPKDAVKAIKKRLQQNTGKNYTVVLYTLTVLETCVKNCSKRFHLLVSQKDFILELVKLIGPKNDPPTAVQEKVLSLIQSWADAFQNNPDMQGVVQVYHDLKQKGIEFPMTDLDTMAPIHTPQRSVPTPATSSAVRPSSDQVAHPTPVFQPLRSNPMPDVLPPQALPLTLNQEQLAKLRSELDIVQGNMKVFGDMLTELTPGKEHPQDLELLQELQKTCYAMQSRIVDLIDRIGVEEITSDLLRINDELNNLFLRYDRYDKKRTAMTSNVEHKLPPPPSAENPIDKPLIDFGEAFEDGDTAAKLSNLNLQDSAASASNEQKSSSLADEFDMFAQARTSSFDSSKTKGSTYEDNTNPNQVEGSLASFAANKGRPMESGDLGSSNVPASNDFANFHNSRTTGLSAGATGASSQSNAVNNRRQMDKDDNDGALFAL